jgi:hypothetical protein
VGFEEAPDLFHPGARGALSELEELPLRGEHRLFEALELRVELAGSKVVTRYGDPPPVDDLDATKRDPRTDAEAIEGLAVHLS